MAVRKKIFRAIRKFFTIIKKLLTYNISTIVFGALLLYMIITVILYASSEHVTPYQVTVGPLTKNPVCTALALRSEQIVPAGSSGYVEYYAREGMQVRKGGSVYALDNIKKEVRNVTLTTEQLAKMRSDMAKFAYGFNDSNFYDTYGFKYEMQGNILQAAGVAEPAAEDDSASIEGQAIGEVVPLGNQTFYTAPEAGVIVYSIDGYEEKTPDNLTEDDFNQKAYMKSDLLTVEKMKKGTPVYKTITSENWTLMVPLTDKLAATIADRESMKVKFIKDGETQNGALSIVNVGDQKVAKIELRNGMVRYASDRFLEIELVINTRSGLKIPVSSIITKEFFLLPRDFISRGGNGDEQGFIRISEKANGKTSTEFVAADIYKEIDAEGKEVTEETMDDAGGYCYVDTGIFHEGDVLQKKDSSETFVAGETDFLEGVYSMNKGYAVFCRIQVLDQNEEYCIVDEKTSYGLRPFDYIVLDGESVKEEDILH